MTMETEDICSGPYEEALAVVGDPKFSQRNLVECLTFAKQLHREFGEPPPGAELVTGSEILDSGDVFWIVRVTYDQDNPDAVAYARRVANGTPRWDPTSIEELARIGARPSGPHGTGSNDGLYPRS